MQIVFDFIAGDIPFDEFWEAYCADPKIGEWLDSIADFSHEPPPVIAKDRLLYALYRPKTRTQRSFAGNVAYII